MARGEDEAMHLARSKGEWPADAPIVLIDSCVWHHSFSRNVLRHLALAMAIRIRWSRSIEAEWIASVQRARPEIPRSRLLMVRDRFRSEFPDGLVPEALPRAGVPRLPDPNDEHVLRAAMHAGATIICTVDRRGFPAEILGPLGITAVPPHAVLSDCIAKQHARGAAALHAHRAGLDRPSLSAREYVDALKKSSLIENAALERQVLRILARRGESARERTD